MAVHNPSLIPVEDIGAKRSFTAEEKRKMVEAPGRKNCRSPLDDGGGVTRSPSRRRGTAPGKAGEFCMLPARAGAALEVPRTAGPLGPGGPCGPWGPVWFH